jgi:hypothetical protein
MFSLHLHDLHMGNPARAAACRSARQAPVMLPHRAAASASGAERSVPPAGRLSVVITVYAAELNVVLARRLWPRSIVQPPLTEADRAVLAAQALQNQRRDDQRVHVSYDDLPPHTAAAASFPRTPDEIVPPPRPPHEDGNAG